MPKVHFGASAIGEPASSPLALRLRGVLIAFAPLAPSARVAQVIHALSLSYSSNIIFAGYPFGIACEACLSDIVIELSSEGRLTEKKEDHTSTAAAHRLPAVHH